MNDKIKRIFAAAIDFSVICFLSTAIIGVITLGKFYVTAFSVIVYLTAFFLFLTFKDFGERNASIGKRIFQLSVAKDDGTKLTAMDRIKRTIPIILLPFEIILLIGENCRLGDIWAKTFVSYNCHDES